MPSFPERIFIKPWIMDSGASPGLSAPWRWLSAREHSGRKKSCKFQSKMQETRKSCEFALDFHRSSALHAGFSLVIRTLMHRFHRLFHRRSGKPIRKNSDIPPIPDWLQIVSNSSLLLRIQLSYNYSFSDFFRQKNQKCRSVFSLLHSVYSRSPKMDLVA